MAEAKIEFQLGKLTFAGEGTEKWLGEQLAFLVSKVPDLTSLPELLEPEAPSQPPAPATPAATKSPVVGSLATHIKSKGGESNQPQRFLATADWLRLKGEKGLKTGMISKALQDNHQKKLANAAECLNRNVTKGYCEKTSDGFFITPEGLKALGHDA